MMNKDLIENKQLITVEVKAACGVNGYDQGQKVNIQTDQNGIPLDRQWRKRLRDSETDGCIKLVTSKNRKAKKVTETKKGN